MIASHPPQERFVVVRGRRLATLGHVAQELERRIPLPCVEIRRQQHGQQRSRCSAHPGLRPPSKRLLRYLPLARRPTHAATAIVPHASVFTPSVPAPSHAGPPRFDYFTKTLHSAPGRTPDDPHVTLLRRIHPCTHHVIEGVHCLVPHSTTVVRPATVRSVGSFKAEGEQSTLVGEQLSEFGCEYRQPSHVP
jgi:hypothetical protein